MNRAVFKIDLQDADHLFFLKPFTSHTAPPCRLCYHAVYQLISGTVLGG